jgi:DNA modification methylase
MRQRRGANFPVNSLVLRAVGCPVATPFLPSSLGRLQNANALGRTYPSATSQVRVWDMMGRRPVDTRITSRIPAVAGKKSAAPLPSRNGKPSISSRPSLNGQVHASHDLKLNEYLIEDARHIGSIFNRQPVIDVTVTSPPYWDVKDYGGKAQIGHGQSLDQYLDDLVSVFTEVWHSTKRTGSLWVVINTVKKDSTLHLLPFKLADRLTNQPTAAWHLQDILVWVKPHTLPWAHKQKLQDHFEYVLCFSKSKSFALNIDALRSPQTLAAWWVKYPERYHPLGKGLNNVWEIHIPTQGSWGNGSMEHACPLPTELTKRIIQLSTDKSGVVFDPFAGTGASVVAAAALGRKWLAIDINRRYREMCYKRLAEETGAGNQNAKVPRSVQEANLNLRQLKYPVLLYKRIAPGLRLTVEDVPMLVVKGGAHMKTLSPGWVAHGQLIVVVRNNMKKKQVQELITAISEQQQVPPLSKFQIDTKVSVVKQRDFAAVRLFAVAEVVSLYTCGRFWRAARDLAPSAIEVIQNKSTFPLLVSDIRVDEQPAH